jgi:hypothetical protein
MAFPGASGSAAGYDFAKQLVIFILNISIFLISVNSMVDMFYLCNTTCHILLVCTEIIFFMMMMIKYCLIKHIYDIMSFLLTSLLWINLNMNLPKFLTIQKRDSRQFSSVGFAGLLKPTVF